MSGHRPAARPSPARAAAPGRAGPAAAGAALARRRAPSRAWPGPWAAPAPPAEAGCRRRAAGRRAAGRPARAPRPTRTPRRPCPAPPRAAPASGGPPRGLPGGAGSCRSGSAAGAAGGPPGRALALGPAGSSQNGSPPPRRPRPRPARRRPGGRPAPAATAAWHRGRGRDGAPRIAAAGRRRASRPSSLVVEVEAGPGQQPVAPRQQGDQQADAGQGGDDHPDHAALVVGAAAARRGARSWWWWPGHPRVPLPGTSRLVTVLKVMPRRLGAAAAAAAPSSSPSSGRRRRGAGAGSRRLVGDGGGGSLVAAAVVGGVRRLGAGRGRRSSCSWSGPGRLGCGGRRDRRTAPTTPPATATRAVTRRRRPQRRRGHGDRPARLCSSAVEHPLHLVGPQPGMRCYPPCRSTTVGGPLCAERESPREHAAGRPAHAQRWWAGQLHGGPPTDLPADERGAVPGAQAVERRRLAHVAGVAAAPGAQVGQHLADGGVEGATRSSGDSPPAGRAGSRPARHRISSASRLPIPATRAWSSSRALSGAVLAPRAGVELGRRQRQRVGAEPRLVGVERHAAEPPGVAQAQLGAVGEAQREAVPARLVAAARVLQPLDRRGPVDQQAAGHAEAQPEPEPVGVRPARRPSSRSRTSSLPRRRAAATVRPASAATTSAGSAALDEPRVGGVGTRDRCARRPPPPGGGTSRPPAARARPAQLRPADPPASRVTPKAVIGRRHGPRRGGQISDVDSHTARRGEQAGASPTATDRARRAASGSSPRA